MANSMNTLGSTPYDESCAQVGSATYERDSRIECQVFQRMLERLFPVPEGVNARLTSRVFPHDFGGYREVCVVFDGESLAAYEYATDLENNTPARWDSQAVWEMVWYGRRYDFAQAVKRGEIAEIPAPYAGNEPPPLDDNSGNGLSSALRSVEQALAA